MNGQSFLIDGFGSSDWMKAIVSTVSIIDSSNLIFVVRINSYLLHLNLKVLMFNHLLLHHMALQHVNLLS